MPVTRFRPLLFFCCLAGVWVNSAAAQGVIVRGFTVDGSSREPLAGVNVILTDEMEKTWGTSSNKDGFFQLTGVPSGRYAVQASFVGYTSYRDTLALGEERIVALTIALTPGEQALEEVVVTGEADIWQDPGVQTIRPEDLERLPTAALGGDLAAYLQYQPGVVSIGDRGGQLFVRGGTAAQNLVLVDGTLMYQPFHVIGFFSAFPQDVVSYVETYAGGYGARYTGRISSVIDISTREGNKLQYDGTASASPFISAVQVEGPIRPGRISFLGSVRRSLVGRTGSFIVGEELPFSFNDVFLKLHASGEDRYRCGVTAVRTTDEGRTMRDNGEPDATFQWTNLALGGQCLALPSESKTRLDVNAGVSYISNRFTEPDDAQRRSSSLLLNTELNLTSSVSPTAEVRWGIFTRMNWIDYNLREFLGIQVGKETLLNAGGYVEGRYQIGERIRVHPGMAVTFDPGPYTFWLEPRLSAIWRPGGPEGTHEFSAAAGIYRQDLEGISDERDAGAVFVAWVPGPIERKESRAAHLLLGWRKQIGFGFRLGTEAYLKRIDNLTVPIWSTIARFTTTLTLARGNVRGVDTWIEYDRGPLYAYAGYGLSRTLYSSKQDNFGEWFGEPVQEYFPPHDRRHQVSTLLSFSHKGYQASIGWQFGSGLPFTRTLGFDELIPLQSLYDVRTSLGITRSIYDKPYLGRLPTYHRLDVSVGKTFEFGPAALTVQAGAVNVYDRANLLYFDLFTFRRLNQLPFFPYASFKLETHR